MKHILLIATGGTIASKDNGNGLTPSIDVNILLEYIPAIRHIWNIHYEYRQQQYEHRLYCQNI